MTGAPVQALGVRRNGAPIWPVFGGSQPLGGPAAGSVQPSAGQPGGQQPVGQFVPGLGGVPVPVLGPGGYPQQQAVPQQPQGVMPGQPQMFGQPGMPGQQFAGQSYGVPQGVMPGQPYAVGGVLPQQQVPFPFPFPQQPQGQPGNGQQPSAPQQGQQPPGQQPQGQQPQGGGQQTGGSDGGWDKPYPQKPLTEMTVEEQNTYWKYHNRKLEDRIRQMGDYDQLKQQLGQLQQMTQTEWQRAVLEAETRGRNSAMEQAAGQMVAVAFQGAASNRMTPDQIQAQLGALDPKRFVHGGQVDIAAIHQYVDTIAPQRQNGLMPVFPPAQNGPQQLPLQQVALGQPQQPLQPGQPGYAAQPTFGPINGQQQPQQFGGQYGQPQFGQPALTGQVLPPNGYGYGQVPIPGVPQAYQPAAQIPQPVVQAAGLAGLPGLAGHRPGLPAATDFGQGPAIGQVHSPQTSGSAMAAARHGKTRSQQLADTRG